MLLPPHLLTRRLLAAALAPSQVVRLEASDPSHGRRAQRVVQNLRARSKGAVLYVWIDVICWNQHPGWLSDPVAEWVPRVTEIGTQLHPWSRSVYMTRGCVASRLIRDRCQPCMCTCCAHSAMPTPVHMRTARACRALTEPLRCGADFGVKVVHV